jgi:Uma2 family endonuclease
MEPYKQEYFTYDDYLTWDEDIRCELIDGVIYDMAQPHPRHQRVQSVLNTELEIYLKGQEMPGLPRAFRRQNQWFHHKGHCS